MTKACTIRILNEVECVVLGLDDGHARELKNRFSPYKDGYFYSKKYQMGHWDGRISFYSAGGRTYVKLLPDIITQVVTWGYKINLVDNRTPVKLTIPPIDKDYFRENNEDIELGDHQVVGVNAILSNQGGIIRAGTGAGKSYMVAAISKAYTEVHKLKVLIIVPNSDLIEQMRLDFIDELQLDVGEYSGDVKDISHPITVSTWQALQNNPQLMSMFQVAIVDECHGAKGDVIKSLLNDHGSHLYIRVGVTGTLPKDEVDSLSVRVTLGDPVFTITSKQLIDAGWLAELDIQLIEMEEDFKAEYKKAKETFPDDMAKITYAKFVEGMFPDYDAEKKYLGTNKNRTNYIARLITIKSLEAKGNTLVLVNSVDTGKRYQQLIEGSHFVYGKDKKAARKAVYNLFKDHDNVVVIATSQLASTGLNIPRIFNLFFIDMGKSYIRTIQSVGRGLRKAHDKFKVLVIDIYSNLKYSKTHKNERVSHYKEAEYDHTVRKASYKG